MRKFYTSIAFLLSFSAFAQPWAGLATGGIGALTLYPITNLNSYMVAAYGDSLTVGGQDGSTPNFPSTFALISHRFTQNYGISGQTSGQILTRLQADNNRFGVYIWWAGRNNYNAVATNPPCPALPVAYTNWCTNQVFNDMCYACNWAQTNGLRRFLVLSVVNGYSGAWPGTEGATTVNYNVITNLNAQMSNAIVANFANVAQYFDIREWLVQQANLAAYTTTAETNNLLYDIPAAHLSILGNPPHLTGSGYEAVGAQVASVLSTGFPNGNFVTVEQMMSLLSSNAYYFNPANPYSPLLFPSLFFAPQLGFHVEQDEFELGFSGNLLSDNNGNLGSPYLPFNQVYAGSLSITNVTVVSNVAAGSFSGNGAGLTNLPPISLWSGGLSTLSASSPINYNLVGNVSSSISPKAQSLAMAGWITNFAASAYGLSPGTNFTLTIYTNGVATAMSLTFTGLSGGGSTAFASYDTTHAYRVTNFEPITLVITQTTPAANSVALNWTLGWRP